jgi:hypothetical protein
VAVEIGEVGGLIGRPSPQKAVWETVPDASFKIVYLRRRKGDREGGKL